MLYLTHMFALVCWDKLKVITCNFNSGIKAAGWRVYCCLHDSIRPLQEPVDPEKHVNQFRMVVKQNVDQSLVKEVKFSMERWHPPRNQLFSHHPWAAQQTRWKHTIGVQFIEWAISPEWPRANNKTVILPPKWREALSVGCEQRHQH